MARRIVLLASVAALASSPGSAGPVIQRNVEGASSPSAVGFLVARSGGERVATIGIIAFRGAITIDGTDEPAGENGVLMLICKKYQCYFVRPTVGAFEVTPEAGAHLEAANGARPIRLDWTASAYDANGCTVGINRRYIAMGLGYTISAGVAKSATVSGTYGGWQLSGSTCTFVGPATRFQAAMSWAN